VTFLFSDAEVALETAEIVIAIADGIEIAIVT